ncbi:MAG TPA: hypothetical protein VNZ06_07575 [Steroidobacteraceae bacterium]|jgi:hypothetical protein|nr:hypothetical protein [Steroidobacteraceae bacterium]
MKTGKLKMKHMLIAGIAVLASACASYKVVPMGQMAYEVQFPAKSCVWCGADDNAVKVATSFCSEQREEAAVIPITPMNWSNSEPGPFVFECIPRG